MKKNFLSAYLLLAVFYFGCEYNSTHRQKDDSKNHLDISKRRDSLPSDEPAPRTLSHLLKPKWKVKISCSENFSPFLKNDKLYALTPDAIITLNAGTGEIEKELRVSGSIGYPYNATIADSVILLQGDRALMAVRDYDSRVLWEYQMKRHFSAPSYFAGQVYVADGSVLSSLNVLSGEKTWSFKADANLYEELSVHDGTILASSKKNLYSLDRVTGRQLWKVHLMDSGLLKPLVHDQTAYLRALESGVYAVDMISKKTIWEYKVEGSGMDLVLKGDSLYTCGRQIHCVNRSNGSHIWTSGLIGATQDMRLLDGYLFLNQTGLESTPVLTVLDKDSGRELYRYWDTDMDQVQLRFSEGWLKRTVFAAGSDGWVYAFELADFPGDSEK